MGVHGGGYTFIHPADLKYLTNAEIQYMYTDRTSFLLRVRHADSTLQAYAILEQLERYKYVLSLCYRPIDNGEGSFPGPRNVQWARNRSKIFCCMFDSKTVGLHLN